MGTFWESFWTAFMGSGAGTVVAIIILGLIAYKIGGSDNES